ncbi:hypothetical protein HCU40_26020, partial [Pseudanabaena biceps]|nr:hypothetical protein [Pseudanabaena biceps]
MRSDVLTLLPTTAATPLIATGQLDALPFPGGATLSVSAVINTVGAVPVMVSDFTAAIRSATSVTRNAPPI